MARPSLHGAAAAGLFFFVAVWSSAVQASLLAPLSWTLDASTLLGGASRIAAGVRHAQQPYGQTEPRWRQAAGRGAQKGFRHRRLMQDLPDTMLLPGMLHLSPLPSSVDPTRSRSIESIIWGPSPEIITVGSRSGGSASGGMSSLQAAVNSSSAVILAEFSAQQPGTLALPADRSVMLTVTDSASGAQRCMETAPYPAASASSVGFECPGLVAGTYDILLTDAEDDQMPPLAEEAGVAIPAAASNPYVLPVLMFTLDLRVGFKTVLWGQSGMGTAKPDQPLQLSEPFPASVAAGRVAPRGAPAPAWLERTTDQDGYMTVTVPNNPTAYFTANFTLHGLGLVNGAQQPFAAPAQAGPQNVVTMTAQRPLLCTGKPVEVYGASGNFPYQDTSSAYFQPNSFCRWLLYPDSTGSVYLKINYAELKPGERLIIGFDPFLTEGLVLQPGDSHNGYLEGLLNVLGSGIPILFSTNNITSAGAGTFSIEWSPGDAPSDNPMQSRLVLGVMCTLLTVGGLVLLGILWCVCGARRRRQQGSVLLANTIPGTESIYPGMRRVPTPVRGLLPEKPYSPPEPNPLPGAEPLEPDCCSICLMEYEAPEKVTVLPCRHYFHGQCIDTWLQRNSTCPLCKADVLDAFEGQQKACSGHRRSQQRTRNRSSRRSGDHGRSRPHMQEMAHRRSTDEAAPALPITQPAAGAGDAVVAVISMVPAASRQRQPAGSGSAAGDDGASTSAGGAVGPTAAAGSPSDSRTMAVHDQDFAAAAAALAALAAGVAPGSAEASSGAGAAARPAGAVQGISGRLLQGFWRQSSRPQQPAGQPAADAAGASTEQPAEAPASSGAVALTVLGPRAADGTRPASDDPAGMGLVGAQPGQQQSPAGATRASFRSRSPVVVYAYADNLGASEGGTAPQEQSPAPSEAARQVLAASPLSRASPVPLLPGAAGRSP